MNVSRLSRGGALMSLAAFAMPRVIRAQAPVHVTVATTPTESGAEVYYALELGLFKSAGIDVEVSSIFNGAPVAAAVASGAVDIGQGNISSIAQAHIRGLPFVIIAPGSAYSSKAPTTLLVVTKDSPIKSAADLVGKTLASDGIKNIGTVATDLWLTQQGVDPASIHWLELGPAAATEAILQGRVAAGLLLEPYLSPALAGGLRPLAPIYSAVGDNYLIGAYFANTEWVRTHPDVVRKFASAIEASARWANTHHADSAKVLQKYDKVIIAPNATRVTYAESLREAQVQPLIDASAKDGLIPAAFPARDMMVR